LAQAAIITTRAFDQVAGGPLGLRPVEFTILQPVHENAPGRNDRRTQNLRVTPKGKARVTSALAKLLKADQELLQNLSEGERRMLLELLHKVAQTRAQ
jgi:hypothetical protein